MMGERFKRWDEGLNPPQREAANTLQGPLMVLAGAGSGKTKMLTSRILHLLTEPSLPVRPENVLAVTFTNKAAQEMRERVDRALGVPLSRTTWGFQSYRAEIGTFHSICVRLLRQEAAALPYGQPFVIYDDSDQLSLIKRVLSENGLDDQKFSPKAIQGAINRAKCDAILPEQYPADARDFFSRKVKDIYELYQKECERNAALDFGDILLRTYTLLMENEGVRKKYQARFQYIHVDEYQDTNKVQYLILMALAHPRYGGHENLCVVGDEDQSIYKWRGADIHNILDFEKDFPTAKVVKLEQNYRSTATIISAASQVISNNSQRKRKELWTENEEGAPIVWYQCSDERMEAENIIREIKKLAEQEGRSFDEFAVFYRTHAQSRPFEDVLRREKIPYQIYGGLRFYDRREVKDILAFFRVFVNPADSVSFKRILGMRPLPIRGIGKTTIEKVDELNRQWGTSYWETLKECARKKEHTSAATCKKIAAFVNWIEPLFEKSKALPPTELYHTLLDATGYIESLKQEDTEESLSRIDNLEELDSVLQEFEESVLENCSAEEREKLIPLLLPRLIEQVSLASDVASDRGSVNEANAGGIASSLKMMTLHASKGLEYPVVFLVGLEEGLFPSVRDWEGVSPDDLEEERRLAYVGMTRARERLYFSSAQVRRIWGSMVFQKPSRFIFETPEVFVQKRDLTRGWGFR